MAENYPDPQTNPEPVQPGPVSSPPGYVQPGPLSPSDERTWAMLAHLSGLLNLVTGFLGPLAAFLIYMVYRDRSRYAAYHALQSALFQLIWWVAPGLLIGLAWSVTGILMGVGVGFLLLPFTVVATILLGLMPLASIAYGVYAAIRVQNGEDFRYWLVGDWVRSTLTGVAQTRS